MSDFEKEKNYMQQPSDSSTKKKQHKSTSHDVVKKFEPAESLSKSAQRVQDALEAKELKFTVRELESSTRTTRDAARTLGCSEAQIMKTLVFKTIPSNKPILVLASGVNRVDEKVIGDIIQEKLVKADASFAKEKTGFAIGGIPPIGHIEPIQTFIDASLFKLDELWAAAGTPNAVFSLHSKDILRLIVDSQIINLSSNNISESQFPVKSPVPPTQSEIKKNPVSKIESIKSKYEQELDTISSELSVLKKAGIALEEKLDSIGLITNIETAKEFAHIVGCDAKQVIQIQVYKIKTIHQTAGCNSILMVQNEKKVVKNTICFSKNEETLALDCYWYQGAELMSRVVNEKNSVKIISLLNKESKEKEAGKSATPLFEEVAFLCGYTPVVLIVLGGTNVISQEAVARFLQQELIAAPELLDSMFDYLTGDSTSIENILTFISSDLTDLKELWVKRQSSVLYCTSTKKLASNTKGHIISPKELNTTTWQSKEPKSIDKKKSMSDAKHESGKASFELISGGSYYFSARLVVGAYVKNNKAILFDSGIDKNNAKQIDNDIKDKRWELIAIINTHHHVDHCGGNQYFQKQYTDLKIYATKFEKAYIDDPSLEPLSFCGGADPFIGLSKDRHIEAEPSLVTHTIAPYADTQLNIDGIELQIVTLPGHTRELIGIITSDKVFYCGDAFFGEQTFTKHGILLHTHIEDTLTTYKKIKKLSFDHSVLYHGGLLPRDKIMPLIDHHTKKLHDQIAYVLSAASRDDGTPSIDTVICRTMTQYQVPSDIVAHTLAKTTIHALITYLQRERKLSLQIKDHVMWVKLATSEIKLAGGLSTSVKSKPIKSDGQDVKSISDGSRISLLGNPQNKNLEFKQFLDDIKYNRLDDVKRKISENHGFLERLDSNKNTLLMHAVMSGHFEMVDALLKYSSMTKKINKKNIDGDTALLLSAKNKLESDTEKAKEFDKIINILRINKANDKITNNHQQSVESLLSSFKDRLSDTPLATI